MHLDKSSVVSTRPPATRTVCLAFAVALILLLFGDVVFLRTSLAPLDYDQSILAQTNPGPQPRSILPERTGRSILDGQGDLWSGSSQFQPAQRFMAFCIRTGESPYWDPYTATGTLGPEALVDLKFAPLTFVTALFGGSSTALTFVLVGMFLISAYSIMRTFTMYLGLSLQAALAASAVFFLNGFALANLNMAIGQPYFLAPIVLHAMLLFLHHETPRNAVFAIAANTALLSTTFTPTAVLALLVVYGITFGFALAQSHYKKLRILAIHVALPTVSLLLLGYLYLPVFDAFHTYLHTFADYNARRTPGISLINLLSIFTPKHLWESYLAMRLPVTAPAGPYNRYTFHLGIIGPLIAVHSLSGMKKQTAPMILAATAFLAAALGQIFGIFPFTLIDSLPFFSFIQNDYWPCIACLSLMLMVAYGYDGLRHTNALNYPSVLLIGVLISSFFYLYIHLGLYDHFGTATDPWTKQYVLIFWIILATAAILLFLSRFPRLTKWTKHLLLICLVGEGVYYMNGLRPYRANRDEHPPESILWLKSEVDRHPGSRILNIGRYGVFPNWGSALQIPQLGLLSFGIAWYQSFFNRYIGSDLFLTLGASPATAVYTFSDASLSLAGVRYVVVDIGNERAVTRLAVMEYQIVHKDALRLIFENPHAMPRSFAVRGVYILDGLPSDLGVSPAHSVATTDQTLLSEVKALGIAVHGPEKPFIPASELADTVEMTEYHHDRIRLRCNLKQAALIVLTDSWNPRWSATVDHKPGYIGKVDVAFRAVAVAAGRHEVEFRYYPLSRLLGQLISGATLMGLAIGLWFWSRFLRLTAVVSVNPKDSARPSKRHSRFRSPA